MTIIIFNPVQINNGIATAFSVATNLLFYRMNKANLKRMFTVEFEL